MLPVYFTHKRFVLLAGKVGRAFARIAKTTPARADLLIRLTEGPVLQRDLIIQLGVCPSVVTRMLAALERLGLVKRSVHPRDRRFRIVTLLEAGLARLRTLWDGHISDHDAVNVQMSAEGYLAYEWEEILDVHGVRSELPASTDEKFLLAHMVKTIARTDYHREWFDPDPNYGSLHRYG